MKTRGDGTCKSPKVWSTQVSVLPVVIVIVVDMSLCLMLFLLHKSLLCYVRRIYLLASDSDGFGHASLVLG